MIMFSVNFYFGKHMEHTYKTLLQMETIKLYIFYNKHQAWQKFLVSSPGKKTNKSNCFTVCTVWLAKMMTIKLWRRCSAGGAVLASHTEATTLTDKELSSNTLKHQLGYLIQKCLIFQPLPDISQIYLTKAMHMPNLCCHDRPMSNTDTSFFVCLYLWI